MRKSSIRKLPTNSPNRTPFPKIWASYILLGRILPKPADAKRAVSVDVSPAQNVFYCAFHKHANSKVQKPPSQLRFSLPSIIITITSNEP